MEQVMANINELVGLTAIGVVREAAGGKRDHNERLVFTIEDGRRFIMTHDQDCCESVYIEDINGDLDWLVGTPIVSAIEASSREESGRGIDSATWTFYRIHTAKGSVVLRWCGESNGYYSESVDCVWEEK
jgi:hypothetical protein